MTQKPFVMFIDHEALQSAHLRAAEKVKEQGPFVRFPNGQEGRSQAYHTLRETTDHIIALSKEGVAELAPVPKPEEKPADQTPPSDLG